MNSWPLMLTVALLVLASWLVLPGGMAPVSAGQPPAVEPAPMATAVAHAPPGAPPRMKTPSLGAPASRRPFAGSGQRGTGRMPALPGGPSQGGIFIPASDHLGGSGKRTDRQQPPLDIELIGQVGGTANALAIRGNYAYLGVGPRLVVMDVSVPAAPRLVAQSALLPDVISALALSGDYAYLASGSAGLRVVQVANPAFPVEVGFLSTPGSAVAVAVAGNHAYVAAGSSGLRIVDVSNPANLVELGVYTNGWEVKDVAVSGGFAFVASTWFYGDPIYGVNVGDVRVVDVSDPARPSEVACFLTSGARAAVSIAGEYAYIASTAGGHMMSPRSYLQVADVSNPRLPVLLSTIAITDASGYGVSRVYKVSASGRFAYVASANGFQIVDVSNPAAPTQLGAYGTWETRSVVASGQYAYAATSDSLSTVDLSQPANPVKAGSYTWPQGGPLALAGRYAYVIGGSGLRLMSVIDVANPSRLAGMGSYLSPDQVWDIAAAGHYVYLATLGLSPRVALRILDASDPANPTAVGSFVGWAGESVAVAGNYAYLVDGAYTLRVIDISDPASPTEVGSLGVTGQVGQFNKVAVAGNYAYLVGFGGFRVVDVSNPASPTQVSLTAGPSDSVAVDDRYAYVCGWSTGLRIFDISNPASPLLVGTYEAPGCRPLAVARSYAYVACDYSYVTNSYTVVQTIDLSDRSRPRLTDTYNVSGGVTGIFADAAYLYAGGPGGIFILGAAAAPGSSIPSLSVSVQGTNRVYPGDALSYSIVLDNSGSTGISVVLTDTIPANTSYVSGTISGGAVYSDTVRSVLWSGAVPPGLSSLPSDVFSFRVRVSSTMPAGAIVNMVIVSDGSNTGMAAATARVFRRTFLPIVTSGPAAW